MSSRWSKALILCNALAGALLLLNLLSHITMIAGGNVPGRDWGMTPNRWKYILLQQAMVAVGLLVFAVLLWFRPTVARLIDLALTIPKLYYGFGFVIWANLSGNSVLRLAALFMLASVLMQPLMWIRNRAKAAAA